MAANDDIAEAFSELVGELDYPMLIVTAASGGERAGCLAGFSTPASLDPPRFMVCISKKNRTYRVAREAPRLALHSLSADDEELAELFGGETGDEVDKFERCEWEEGPDRVPLLSGPPARISGPVIEVHDAGDHVAFLVEAEQVERSSAFRPYRTHQGERMEPGHEP